MHNIELNDEELRIITALLGNASTYVIENAGCDPDIHYKLFNRLADICEAKKLNYMSPNFLIKLVDDPRDNTD